MQEIQSETKTKKAKPRKRSSPAEMAVKKKIVAFAKSINADLDKVSKKIKKFMKG